MKAKVNGTELFYDIVGSQLMPVGGEMIERPVCFVLHGGPLIDLGYLRPWMDDLADVMQLVYVDYRGTGRSERMAPEHYSLENTIDDLEALRLHLGLERVAVLGHSHGGILAMPFTLKYPASVSHLILVATTPYTGPEHEAESEANQAALAAARPELAALLDQLTQRAFRQPKTDEEHRARFRQTFRLYFHRHDPQIVRDVAERTIFSTEKLRYWIEHESHRYDVRSRLPEIRAPTLILAARHDWRTTVKQARIMEAGIPGSELAIFEESGHQLYIEEQEKFLATVRDFIQRNPL